MVRAHQHGQCVPRNKTLLDKVHHLGEDGDGLPLVSKLEMRQAQRYKIHRLWASP